MRILPKEAQKILIEIKKLRYLPTSKEDKFFKSVKELIKRDWRLSEAQSKWLNDIYCKSAGGGQYQDKQYIEKT